jgi:hypothetical protein
VCGLERPMYMDLGGRLDGDRTGGVGVGVCSNVAPIEGEWMGGRAEVSCVFGTQQRGEGSVR